MTQEANTPGPEEVLARRQRLMALAERASEKLTQRGHHVTRIPAPAPPPLGSFADDDPETHREFAEAKHGKCPKDA